MSGRNPIPRAQAYEGVKASNPPDIISAKRDPLPSDFGYPLGTFWINALTPKAFQLVASPGVWVASSAATGGPLSSLTGDAGAANPAFDNINVIGGDNISTTGAGDTLSIATIDNPQFVSLDLIGDFTSTNGDIFLDNGGITALNGDINCGGTIFADLGFVVFNGDFSALNGDVSGNTLYFNQRLRGNAPGTYLELVGGAATDFIGQATLVLGTVTIANTSILATDRILIQRISPNASVTLGELTYSITPGASFNITSVTLASPGVTQVADVSTVAYFIIRQI